VSGHKIYIPVKDRVHISHRRMGYARNFPSSQQLRRLDLLRRASRAPQSEGFAPDAVDRREAVTTQPDGYPSLPVAVQSPMLAKSEASEAARSRPLTGIRAAVSGQLCRAWGEIAWSRRLDGHH